MAKGLPGIGQGVLLVPEEYRAPEVPPGIDLERRMSFSHLINVISRWVNLPPDYTTKEDLEKVEPAGVEAGLYFGERDAYANRRKNVYLGIGFTATDFLEIGRSPADLAAHAYAQAQRANEKRPNEQKLDRDTLRHTASRAAGHVLENRVLRLETIRGQISEQRLCLRALYDELHSRGYAHWSGRNLDQLRRSSSDVIHSDVEIAAINLHWSNLTADSLQRALNYNLYGRVGQNNTRVGYWRKYVLMAGKQAKRQLSAIGISLSRTIDELEKYRPFLENKKQNDG